MKLQPKPAWFVAALVLCLLVAPLVLSEFSITLLNYIGLCFTGRAWPRAADGRQRVDFVRAGGIRRRGCVYDGGADDIDRAAESALRGWPHRRGSR